MNIESAAKINGLIVAENWTGAANEIMRLVGKAADVTSKPQAVKICRDLFTHLLDKEMYLHAATLQWGGDMFNAGPECVQRVFAALHSNSKLLLCGASSMGKSYSAGAWMYLDWRRDPLYTAIKCVGVSEDQVRKHVFAHIVKLHRACAIPMVEEVVVRESDMWMGVKDAGNEFGITAIAYKQSQETSGGIKGYKSMAVRKKPHQKFGMMSRLRLLGDEGQNWPNGPFKDLNTWVSQIDGPERVKIAIAFNPESQSQLVVSMAEPEGGYREEQLDSLYDWTSNKGWRVCRLDAAKSENVINRKVVYYGLQTYDGYIGYLQSGGDNSPNYFTFARGFPPVRGSADVIIPPAWPQDARGEATFIEVPVNCGAVDLAFMGKDSAQMAVGRWGLASGYRDQSGKFITFKNRLDISSDKPRHVLQIDQILPLGKHDDTVQMAEEIIGRCKMLEIRPEYLAVDKTGYGFGVHGHLVKVWGDCFGVAWNEKATERKIVAEDLEGADKQCDGVMSEMWWAFRKWLEPACRAILINPIIPAQPIHTQLTTRRYRGGTQKGIKVEKKEEYMARNANHSPDEADALVMLVHVVRKNSDVIPGLVEQQSSSGNFNNKDRIKFISVKNMVSVEQADSICADGQED